LAKKNTNRGGGEEEFAAGRKGRGLLMRKTSIFFSGMCGRKGTGRWENGKL